jgi:short-subunit dehydrogenase
VADKRSWRGLVAVITGASGGIGEELAAQLAAGGASVVLAARRGEELERVAARCGASGAEVLVRVTDVSVQDDCRSLIEAAVARFGRLDVLVNNAGQGMWGRADAMVDLSVFETMLRVNYLGAVWVTLAALPHLRATRGRVLTVSSLSGKTGVPLRSGYGAAKHALNGFLESLRIELRGSGVTLTTIHPGFVTTGSQARNLGPDGRPLGTMPIKVTRGLSAADCAAMLLAAGAARRRDVVPGLRAKLGLWLKLVAPEFVDRMAARAIRGD